MKADSDFAYRILEHRAQGMYTDRMRATLNYINQPYNTLDQQIQAIGKKKALTEPNIPFNLNRPEGGTIIAAALSDGNITRNGLKFSYSNKDPVLIDDVRKAVETVYGQAHHDIRTDEKERTKLTYPSRVIGESLIRAGVAEGTKVTKNQSLPSICWIANDEFCRNFVRQVWGDEGTTRFYTTKDGVSEVEKRGIGYSRSVDITQTVRERGLAGFLETREWKIAPRGDGSAKVYLGWAEVKDTSSMASLKQAVEDGRCKLVHEERDFTKERFSLEPNVDPVCIYRTRRGYSVEWRSTIIKQEDLVAFHKKIGFPDPKKQEVLKRIIESIGTEDESKATEQSTEGNDAE